MSERSLMRWMTMAWWRGDVPRESADGYAKHFETVRDRLPADLRDFHSDVTLHDGKLTRFDVDLGRRTVVAEYLGHHWQPGRMPDGTCLWRLRYEGVDSIQTSAAPDDGLGGPSGFGDFGYDELDVTAAGQVVHRFVFSTAIEMAITFETLHVERE